MAAVLAMATEPVHAYYDDTHYSLTYFIARSCGYTPLQAYRIASATLAVDYSETSEPEQRLKMIDLAETAQDAREQFHAIWDYRIPTSRFSLQEAAWKGRELKWMQLARDQRNPGVVLHYVQDEAPHTGYSSFGGHWFPSAQDAMDPPLDADRPGEQRLPFGPQNDFLSNNQSRAVRMVGKTVAMLKTFMEAMSPKQRVGIGCNQAAILPVLGALVAANDLNNPVHAPVYEYARQVDLLMDAMKRDNVTDAQIRAVYLALSASWETFGVAAAASAVPPAVAVGVLSTAAGRQAVSVAIAAWRAKAAAPKVEPADAAVARFLTGQTPPYEPANRREKYSYTTAGRNPMSDLPPFAVYGTLKTNVRGAAGRTVEVSVWAAPTRVGEQPYQLDCKSGSELTSFDNLPVGNLIIQTSVDGKVTKHPQFTFDAKPLQFTNVTVAAAMKKNEQQSECRKKAAEKSKAVCESFSPGASKASIGNAPVNVNQSQRLEDDFAKQLDDCDKEDDKKQTENNEQPTQQTPPGGNGGSGGHGVGTAIKAGVVIAGAAVGGLYLKSELAKIEEESVFTTTTSTTTTTTPTTTTPVSAGTMTYVSGTFTCTFNAGGILNLCNNSNIRVNITTRMAVGTTLRLTASGMVSSSLPQTTTDPPGQVTFQNFNGPGNFDTCPSPIGQLLLFNISSPNSPIATASVSIPVSCR